jgi:hypothetical protein
MLVDIRFSKADIRAATSNDKKAELLGIALHYWT